MRWSDGITDSMDIESTEFEQTLGDSEGLHAAVHGISKSRTQLSD